ncbi:AAA family ATPase [Corynebacterium glutamicum]|uniref:AAA family ATPase n=1 Tax=Corynebacterium glutamicum TaxID=1718 RepID=UPI001B8B8B7C|nr:AAA family ATPase [Corynebacterium glutamicum]
MANHSFQVKERNSYKARRSAHVFTLEIDNWDDYHFQTTFNLFYGTGTSFIEIGSVKIASKGMEEWAPHTALPQYFASLNSDFFSLGQSREYYENLIDLPGQAGHWAMKGLNDLAANPALLENVKNERVFEISLLRSIPLQTVKEQFHRIAQGLSNITSYSFSYNRNETNDISPPLTLNFEVDPQQTPPTNLHVLIGANGVGKSRLLNEFVITASGSSQFGAFREIVTPKMPSRGLAFPFVNIIHISFSAFDVQMPVKPRASSLIKFHNVGLGGAEGPTLTQQFLKSLVICSQSPRAERWKSAINFFSQADSVLEDHALHQLIPDGNEPDFATAEHLFERMSSGHKIALLTITRIIELVEEKSLVLIDEPETHLHPPLLSTLMRVVSDLLIDRNGIAIIATHSPVVLQEVPRSCVWTLRRNGDDVRASRPEIETFGESVTQLTSTVFGLDINHTGYKVILEKLLSENNASASRTIELLSNQLGSEGRFLLSALASRKSNTNE